MGKRRTRTTQTNRPIYSGQIEGAANTITNAYNQSAPIANQVSNNMAGLSNDLLGQIRNEGSAIGSANTFLNDMLTSDPTENPYLDAMVERTNNSVRNQMQARSAVRGITGGSDYENILARALAGRYRGGGGAHGSGPDRGRLYRGHDRPFCAGRACRVAANPREAAQSAALNSILNISRVLLCPSGTRTE